MKKNKILRILLVLTILVSNVGCDQISKKIVRHSIDYHEKINVIHDNLILTKIENTGAFLSIGSTLPEPVRLIVLTILPLLVLGVAIYYMFTKINDPLSGTALACIIGGGMGNLYDRIAFGSVTDFVHIDLGWVQTGIFNMADVSIMTGVILLIANQYINPRKHKLQENNNMKTDQ